MRKKVTLKNHIEESQFFSRRALSALMIVVALIAVLIIRLAYLQVSQHDRYQTLSDNNRINVLPIAPTRGLIYDRNSHLLAENVPAFHLEITPERVSNINSLLAKLSTILDISEDDKNYFFKQLQHKRRFEGVPLRLQLTEQERARFAVNRYQLPGVEIVAGLVRNYPFNSDLAHVLGYVGRINEQELKKLNPSNYRASQYIGKLGIEHYYENELHGITGNQKVETDVHGRVIRVLQRTAPQPGDDLYLTIDIRLQHIAQRALAGKRGALIAVDPQTGEILAMISEPSFNPNEFVVGIKSKNYQQLQKSPDKPLFNRALRGQYPPGSTIKPIIALQALEKKVVSGLTPIYDPGWFQLPGSNYKYREWKRKGHGWIDMRGAIAQSCSTYFYFIAQLLGIDAMHDALTEFGFGSKTNIDITGEAKGLVPSAQWKQHHLKQVWFPGETLITGIGQGFTLVTPLQLAQEITILANHGQAKQLHLVASKSMGHGKPLPVKLPASSATNFNNNQAWDLVLTAMHDVTANIHGTAYSAFKGAHYTVAGKTGTAQVTTIKQGERYNPKHIAERLRDHSLFIGYAPIEQPQIAIAIILENNHGSSTISRTVMDSYFALKQS